MLGSRLWAALSGVPRKMSRHRIEKPAFSKAVEWFSISRATNTLISSVQYQAGVLAIRYFGIHAEYDKIDAQTV